jgi:hypothetical protein
MGPGTKKKKRNTCYIDIYTRIHTCTQQAHTNFWVTSRSPSIFFLFLSSPCNSPNQDKMYTFTQNQWTRRVRIYVHVLASVCVYSARVSPESRGDIDSGRRGWFLAVFQGIRWSLSLGQNVSHAKGALSNYALKR